MPSQDLQAVVLGPSLQHWQDLQRHVFPANILVQVIKKKKKKAKFYKLEKIIEKERSSWLTN